ncbi:(2Fe-2S)-binding protein [Spirochaeta isovalerica]|uniref:Carbon-monoxide dehydrogenase small subunit n=1 Tax=Spirochaeta isovalerica TaxID=150 RepID=A0A841R8I6_9SPIO|nr:(2Fe-2S)-binding protein [Spirochaeta isovalerica]MBB6479497.1 carbon-monoxide dehydrogenase small subunit [Spirochaeta isovalerica]
MKKKIDFVLNGAKVSMEIDPLKRLLDVLREDCALTSVKEGCGEGECGACSVLLDGEIVNSCLIPVGTIEGAAVETVEGIRESENGKRIIDAFAEEGAVQCGFCTPGMMVGAEWILRKYEDPTSDEIRTALSGNLCRCTGYDMIISAVKAAAKGGRK